jgi:hypothetical protein
VRSATTAVILTAVAAFAQTPASRPAADFSIDSDAAMVTIAVRPERGPAFDAVLDKLKSALIRSKNPQRRAQAAGWQMFKSEETAQGLTYVMRIDPAVRGADYEWGRIIAEEFASDEAEINRVLREAIVTRTVLALTPVTVPGLGEPEADDPEGRPYTEPRVPVLSFDTAQAAVITVLVRPTRESEFISTLGYLGKALRASASASRRRQARGWRVFKSSQMFGENNVAYVMSLDPVVNRAEYDVIRLIQETFPGEVDAIFGKYREAYAGQAVSRLTNRIEMSK